MPTEEWFKENPKVSGYISKTLYERLKYFASEQRSSISQALTVVLAEYFGVDQEVDRASIGGVTLAKFQKHKEELDKLTKFLNQELVLLNQRLLKLESEVDFTKTISSLQVNQNSSTKTQNKESETIGSVDDLSNKTPREEPKGDAQIERNQASKILPSRLNSRLLEGELEEVVLGPQTTDVTGGDETKTIPGVRPLTGIELSQRLETESSLITRYKNGKRKKSLSEWSKELDPESVAWGFSEELKKYIPVQDAWDHSTSSLQFELPNEESSSDFKPSLEQKAFDGTPFTEEQLAARFGMTSKRSLGNQRTGKLAASFPEWSRSKDPDGVTWHYVQESKLYYPASLPSQPKSELLNFDYKTDSGLSNPNKSTK